MGKRGPVPKSRALKVQSGVIPVTKEGVKSLLRHSDLPKPPKHFRKEERAVWRVTVDMLKDSRIIENIDQGILGAYCDSYVKWQKAEAILQEVEKEYGLKAMFITMGATGGPVVNPLITISRKAQSDMVGYAAQLGMTPAARLRIQVIPAKEKSNPFERLKGSNGNDMDADCKGLRQIIDAQAEQR